METLLGSHDCCGDSEGFPTEEALDLKHDLQTLFQLRVTARALIMNKLSFFRHPYNPHT